MLTHPPTLPPLPAAPTHSFAAPTHPSAAPTHPSAAPITPICRPYHTHPPTLPPPSAAPTHPQGVVDLVKMKAIVWTGEELGAKFEERDIPADLADKAAEYREKLIDAIVELDDQVRGVGGQEERDVGGGENRRRGWRVELDREAEGCEEGRGVVWRGEGGGNAARGAGRPGGWVGGGAGGGGTRSRGSRKKEVGRGVGRVIQRGERAVGSIQGLGWCCPHRGRRPHANRTLLVAGCIR